MAKWKPVLASPLVHRETVDGKKPTEILHKHSIGTEGRTNAKTSNVDNMTMKQLFSDLSESHLARNLQDSDLLRWRRGTQLPQALALAATLRIAMTMDYAAGLGGIEPLAPTVLAGSCACAARAGG